VKALARFKERVGLEKIIEGWWKGLRRGGRICAAPARSCWISSMSRIRPRFVCVRGRERAAFCQSEVEAGADLMA